MAWHDLSEKKNGDSMVYIKVGAVGKNNVFRRQTMGVKLQTNFFDE
jgi:hypothetical protein